MMNYLKWPFIVLAVSFLSADLAKGQSDNERRDAKGSRHAKADVQKGSIPAAPQQEKRQHLKNRPHAEKPNVIKTNPAKIPRSEKAPIQQKASQVKAAVIQTTPRQTSSHKSHAPNTSRTPSISRTKYRSRHPRTSGEVKPQGTTQDTVRSFTIPSSRDRQAKVREHTRNTNQTQAISKQQRQNREAVNRVKERVRHAHPNHHRWFNHDFFQRHHFNADYYNAANNWWRAPQWGVVTYWIRTNWSYPLDYTEIEYPAEVMVDTNEAYEPSDITGEWLPLGVFAAGKTVEQAAFSSMFIQLVVNKERDIAGVYYNSTTDETHPIAGMIDEDTQQVLWKLSDNPDSPLMVTGIYNLTQDVVSVQVFFPDDTEQTWTLVRIN
jgi:hypothetical protein